LVIPVPFGGSFQTSKPLTLRFTCSANRVTYLDQAGRLLTGSVPGRSSLFQRGLPIKMAPNSIATTISLSKSDFHSAPLQAEGFRTHNRPLPHAGVTRRSTKKREPRNLGPRL
jgi:hypothetical protein